MTRSLVPALVLAFVRRPSPAAAQRFTLAPELGVYIPTARPPSL